MIEGHDLVMHHKLYFKSIQIQIVQVNMADIVRVKAKKNFEWDQDNKYVFVRIPMPGHTTIKNIEIYLSDLILRITSKQKKSAETLDLLKQVEYLSPENKFVLSDGIVSATLKKKIPNQSWPNLLVEDISVAELKVRRRESEQRYQQNSKNLQQTKQKLKTQYDRKATQEMMRFEEEERKKLDKKKEDEKQAALNQVFRNIDEKTGKIQYEGNKWEKKGIKALEQLQKQQSQQYQRQKQERKKLQQQKYLKESQTKNVGVRNKKNEIFSQEDVKYHDEIRNNVEEQIQQIPVRKQAKVAVSFTEKLYPNVATRDYHYTQPPMPKGSAPLPPPRGGDIENRNPLWLKDRGDAFMRNKNYSAALDAYNQAIKIDPTQRKILMNRSLAHMKLLNFDSALNDCEQVLSQMQKELVNSQGNKEESLEDLIKMKSRKGVIIAYKGKLAESKQIFSELLTYSPSAQIKQQIQKCLQTIKKRQQSISIKTKGDDCVKRQAYKQAITYYDTAIQTDNNEYALSNKALCLNKSQRYEESLGVCDLGIKSVEEFLGGQISSVNKNNADLTNILVKLLYRKSNAHQFLKQFKQAQHTLSKAFELNPEDKDIKTALKVIQSQKQSQQYQKLKQQASVELNKNQPQQALNIYAKCLKLVQSPQKVQEYLSILQNQCVCYLKLKQFDNIIALSIRILTIINNLRNKIVQFGDRKNNMLDKSSLDKISVRTLMRRANAYLQTGQIYNAKSDLEKATQIDPTDQTVQDQLEKLKQSIRTN